jgi:hypothetical protein
MAFGDTQERICTSCTPKPKARSGGGRYAWRTQSALTWRRLAVFGENILLPPPVGAVRPADVQRRNITCACMS